MAKRGPKRELDLELQYCELLRLGLNHWRGWLAVPRAGSRWQRSSRRRRREAAELLLEQLGETNGRVVFEDRTNELNTDGQPIA